MARGFFFRALNDRSSVTMEMGGFHLFLLDWQFTLDARGGGIEGAGMGICTEGNLM